MKLPSGANADLFKKALGSKKRLTTSNKLVFILLPILIVIAVLLILFKDQLSSWTQKYQTGLVLVPDTTTQESKPFVPITPTPTPTPIPLLPGPGIYNVSQAKHEGATISKVTFDPLDVKKGQNLEITVEIKAESAITAVTGTLKTDNGQKELTFSRTSGSDTDGQWQISFKLEDSVLYNYILTVKAVAGGIPSEVIVAPRS
jgi:hypothetical protein